MRDWLAHCNTYSDTHTHTYTAAARSSHFCRASWEGLCSSQPDSGGRRTGSVYVYVYLYIEPHKGLASSEWLKPTKYPRKYNLIFACVLYKCRQEEGRQEEGRQFLARQCFLLVCCKERKKAVILRAVVYQLTSWGTLGVFSRGRGVQEIELRQALQPPAKNNPTLDLSFSYSTNRTWVCSFLSAGHKQMSHSHSPHRAPF